MRERGRSSGGSAMCTLPLSVVREQIKLELAVLR